ncbi:hypothetical protein BDN70DRAFT_939915 [Pholiota conissans]|uniref:Uncharacterized protein n=1 Tax=Pholiota conissans TaxID=109636 RepID=A0A9P5YKC6_9AGAR|nr:hypothetical protein BDN70DRAFT_939915 [Pholiota conissans]
MTAFMLALLSLGCDHRREPPGLDCQLAWGPTASSHPETRWIRNSVAMPSTWRTALSTSTTCPERTCVGSVYCSQGSALLNAYA